MTSRPRGAGPGQSSTTAQTSAVDATMASTMRAWWKGTRATSCPSNGAVAMPVLTEGELAHGRLGRTCA